MTCATETEPCQFRDLCEMCHPEEEMAQKRENCHAETSYDCAVFWAFRDGYTAFEED